jgi:hypothetical protein
LLKIANCEVGNVAVYIAWAKYLLNADVLMLDRVVITLLESYIKSNVDNFTFTLTVFPLTIQFVAVALVLFDKCTIGTNLFTEGLPTKKPSETSYEL